MDAELQRRLARRAASQSGLITRLQLLAIGFTTHQVKGCVGNGRLLVLHRGIYLVGGAALTDSVRLHAATLATKGVASHRSAAHALGLIDIAPTRPEITVDADANSRGPFIVHRSGDLERRDTIAMNGVSTTNATRTLVDLGAVVRADVLETALERALLRRTTTFDRLLRRFFELAVSGRPGIAVMRSLLVARDPTLAPAESDLETLLFKILRHGGLPAPIRQHVVEIDGHCFYLDAAYPRVDDLHRGRRLWRAFAARSVRTRSLETELVGGRWLATVAIHLASAVSRSRWCRERGARGTNSSGAHVLGANGALTAPQLHEEPLAGRSRGARVRVRSSSAIGRSCSPPTAPFG